VPCGGDRNEASGDWEDVVFDTGKGIGEVGGSWRGRAGEEFTEELDDDDDEGRGCAGDWPGGGMTLA